MTDIERVDCLLKYILARAGQEEGLHRELGAIHLVKYVYLADLAFAERHGGTTFTGAAWRFHHYGPWATEVWQRIEPIVNLVGAVERRFAGPKFDGEGIRWRIDDPSLADRLEDELPIEVTSAIKHAIRQFDGDTPTLLHAVYGTRPMLQASPGDNLRFSSIEGSRTSDSAVDSTEPLTAKQARERKAALKALRERIRAKLASPRQGRLAPVHPPPRYDDVFAAGQEWLDHQAGEAIEAAEAVMEIDPGVWKSRGRRESEIS